MVQPFTKTGFFLITIVFYLTSNECVIKLFLDIRHNKIISYYNNLFYQKHLREKFTFVRNCFGTQSLCLLNSLKFLFEEKGNNFLTL